MVLLESGGFELEPDIQARYRGLLDGPYFPLDSTRLRYFGGSTNHWVGLTPALEPGDFERRTPHTALPSPSARPGAGALRPL